MLEGSAFRAVIYNAAKENNLDRIKVFLDVPRSDKWINECLNDIDDEKIPLVVAARYGFLSIVEYLVSKGADASVRGLVSFDGEVISSSPALWAAAAGGHLNVVKYLVETVGVNINQPTATNSTPLRGACYDGHLDIVKFLVEHGADVEMANRHGHTPLMIACYRGHGEVVDYLLTQGADIGRRSHRGNTALHDAAEGDQDDICEILMQVGASLEDDDDGICPLMSSALLGNGKSLNTLILYCHSALKRRDALKLFGCTLCDKKLNLAAAIKAWKVAVKVTVTSDEKATISKFVAPDVYGEIKEIETTEDVTAIEGQPELIHMQSLLMRERILGQAHNDVHHYLRFRGAVYLEQGRSSRCFDLWFHALHLQQENLPPMNISTISMFESFQETYAMAANQHRNNEFGWLHYPVDASSIADILERICSELERYADWPKDTPLNDDCCEMHEHDPEESKEKLVLVALHLILLVKRLTHVGPLPEMNVQRLVRVCSRLEILPLHLALQEATDSLDPYVKDLFPCPFVVEELLKAGARVDVVDSDRNTPLHVLLLNEKPRESIVRLLLEGNAPILARNDQDSTCLDLMELSNLKTVPSGRYISLMGLSANAVSRSGDSCLGLEILPQHLHDFLSIH